MSKKNQNLKYPQYPHYPKNIKNPPDPPDPNSSGSVFLKQGQKRIRGLQADHGFLGFAVLKNHQGRNAHNPVIHGDLAGFFGIDLADHGFVADAFGHLFNNRALDLARTAPRREKINQYGLALGGFQNFFLEILVSKLH